MTMFKQFKSLFALKPMVDNPYRVLMIGFAIFIVLMVGYWRNDFLISNFASLGLFTLFYYQNLPMPYLLRNLGIIGGSLLLVFLLGFLSSYSPWFSPLVVGVIAFISRLLTRLFNVHKPGGIFFVMVAAMGTTIAIPEKKLVEVILFFLLGIVISLIGAVIIKKTETRVEVAVPHNTFKERFFKDPLALVDAIFYSSALFMSVYLSHGLHLGNPYWVTLACAAILLAENLEALKHRHLQYLAGTFVGLVVASLLLVLPLSRVLLILLITILYALAQYYVPRNYAVANIFITPMVILLSVTNNSDLSLHLFQSRFIGVLLGSFIGFGTAWLMWLMLNHYLAVTKNISEVSDEENHQ
ncbi:FUSC family protein [Streptococcus pacificus]|uniref:FUSC family protein n=1 Tax=Streptococcus pacificus TaxID=2740577 RepID=A0ABS0ZK79_9STRE|nr:FUSC family protein [Streptococcus pacificus]MBJ8326118.1 FUSC family protein [Streptococcus pacificus]